MALGTGVTLASGRVLEVVWGSGYAESGILACPRWSRPIVPGM